MKILDACCGSRMFWYDKHESHTTYMDKRVEFERLPTGHLIDVKPDVQADFKHMPFSDCEFDLVVFDPPHLIKVGNNSWMFKKYGRLPDNWSEELKAGFDECMRVLKPNGSLIFKWNEEQIKFGQVIQIFEQRPIFGDKRAKTRWSVFIKDGD